MAIFSVRRKTPPLRLTSRVSAVCLNVAPLLVTQDASTGMQKVTRSLWRRPSEIVVVIEYFTELLKFRLACKSSGNRAMRRVLSFQLITHEGHRRRSSGAGRCCLFRVADLWKSPLNGAIRANLLE